MGGMGHKNWCDYPSGPCDCGYYKVQDSHKRWCGYPSEPCSCDKGLSQSDKDSGKKRSYKEYIGTKNKK